MEIKDNSWNVLIGVRPFNNNDSKNPHYYRCWSFICGCSQLSIKSGFTTKYNNHSGQLKKGDIIEVIIDRKRGELSFAVNEINYGVSCFGLPKKILYIQLL